MKGIATCALMALTIGTAGAAEGLNDSAYLEPSALPCHL